MHTSSDHPTSPGEREFSFGAFRFIPSQHLLLHDETPLRLGGRALDILKVLLERTGELVSKKDLINLVWPDSVVDDGNLKVHIAALRRALGAGHHGICHIATVSGRGYRFATPVSIKAGTAPPTRDLPAAGPMHALPAPATRMLGRAAAVGDLLQSLAQHRIVSVVGPGGIGKTTVAVSIAKALSIQHGMDCCYVDLSPLDAGQFVAGAVAAALGLAVHSDDCAHALIAKLRERRLLLVLDSCEHVIDTVAVLVERIVSAASGVLVLTTSREPLRASGEVVHRLAPLDYPAAGSKLTAREALEFAAVQLFVERAGECLDGYLFTDADAPAVAEICRRLEGIALAIELAAMRIDAFGARELAARLDDRFRLLRRGRRSAQERHSTLSAALDWSYEFLPEDERTLLRRLSVFAGAFTLDTAIRLCQDAPDQAIAIIDAAANLVAKSMLSADFSGPAVYYRLLDTTKAYALDKLDQTGEMAAMRSRYAEFLRAMFARAETEWGKSPHAGWLASYGRSLDDVRSALAWAFSPTGDAAVGIALTVGAIPLWMSLSLLDECRSGVERALAAGRPGARDEMKLQAALATAILYSRGPVQETNAAWTRTLALADALEDGGYQLRALWGMAVYCGYGGDYPAVLGMASAACAVAERTGDRAALASFERLIATALHYGGEQLEARSRLEQVLSQHAAPGHGADMASFQLDQRSAALGTLAQVLWLQGYPLQAAQMARIALQEAREAGHMPSLLHAYAHAAFPILLAVGDYAAAEGLLDELADLLSTRALTLWHALARCLRALLQARRGDLSNLPLLRGSLNELREAGFHLRVIGYLGTLAAALGAHGQHNEGLAVISAALSTCEAGAERWCYAELLRIKGELLEASDGAAAEQYYRQALEVAERQGALSWQLRAASSLAQLKCRGNANDEARQVLLDVFNSFNEGFDGGDLRQARALLDGTVLPPGLRWWQYAGAG